MKLDVASLSGNVLWIEWRLKLLSFCSICSRALVLAARPIANVDCMQYLTLYILTAHLHGCDSTCHFNIIFFITYNFCTVFSQHIVKRAC